MDVIFEWGFWLGVALGFVGAGWFEWRAARRRPAPWYGVPNVEDSLYDIRPLLWTTGEGE